MSQRVDINGIPASGWLLNVYAANSSTPSDVFQDTALTIAATNPLIADASGMMPPFWLADGSYRVRGTSADASTVYFDQQSVLALGASSGSAPSGGVDPNTIFATGDSMFQPVSGTRSGWVRDNFRTIGSATSGASERANADCQALFEYYWNTYSDTLCPVVGGRGANAAADWAANKQITTLDMRGVGSLGLDDMGNSAASRLASAPFVNGNATTPGSICGENTHTLTKAEAPTGLFTLTDPGHIHTLHVTNNVFAGGPNGTSPGGVSGTVNIDSATTGITLNDNGGDGAHNVVQRSVLGTWYRKL